MRKLFVLATVVAIAFAGLVASPASAAANDSMHAPQVLSAGAPCGDTVQCGFTRVSGSNVGATREPGEPSHWGSSSGSSVWYRFDVPRTGHLGGYVVSPGTQAGRAFEPIFTAYRKASDGTLVFAKHGTNATNFSDMTSFAVARGEVILLVVDGQFGSQGTFDIGLRFDWTPPTVSLDPAGASGLERDTDEYSTMLFKVNVSKPWADYISYTATTRAWGSATEDVDFRKRTVTFKIRPGHTTSGVKGVIIGDRRNEGPQDFYLEITDVSNNAKLDTAKRYARGTIVDDESL